MIGNNVKIQNNVSVYTGVELEDDKVIVGRFFMEHMLPATATHLRPACLLA